MPASLVAACPLCGLRFTNRALLELHLREDHPRPQPKDGRNGLARAAEAAAPPVPGGRYRSADQARPEALMSPAMSWAEHLVMVAAISVSLAVMIAVVFLAEHQSDSRRSHTGGRPGGKRRRLSKR
jgi:hypothetical protein